MLMPLADPAAAEAVLDEALATITDPAPRLMLLGRQATMRLFDGKPNEALAAAEALLDADDDQIVARGSYVSSIALALMGRGDEGVAVAHDGIAAHRRAGGSTQLPEQQLVGASLSHLSLGELAEAEAVAGLAYDASLGSGDREGQARHLLLGGNALVERGRLGAAIGRFREGAAINRELRDDVALRWCLGGLALAEGMSGRADQALRAATEIDGLLAAKVNFLEFEVVQRGRAWSLAANGELSRAIEILASAAADAGSSGLLVAEAQLRHDIARLGDVAGAAVRLAELAELVRGRLVVAFAQHASALRRRSSSELESASLAFEAFGADLLAAEAAVAAAHLFRSQGLSRRATALNHRADDLLAACRRCANACAAARRCAHASHPTRTRDRRSRRDRNNEPGDRGESRHLGAYG